MRLLVEIALVVIAAGVVLACVACLPNAAPARRRRVERSAPPRPEQLIELEKLAGTSEASALTAHAYLRPLLIEIATRRLRARGRVLDRMSDAAGQEVLGGPLWEIIRPGRPFPQDRYGPGIPLGELGAMLEVLERL